MKSASIPASPPRCGRNCELLVLAAAMLATTLLFWTTDLDLYLAGLFFDPQDPAGPWPQEQRMPWLFFYYGVPLFTAALAGAALLALLLGLLVPRWRALRPAAALLLLTLAIGPGLLINLLFKEHWGRPRPHQVEQFGGQLHYVPPLAIGQPGVGKSFCSGHASIGFSLVVFWFLFRRRQPRLAWTFFLAAIGLGLLLGVGRMAGGGHFLSDVLWSGYLTFLSAWLAYHVVLRLPRHAAREVEPAPPYATSWRSPAAIIGYLLVASVVVIGALANTPVNRRLGHTPTGTTHDFPPTLYVELDRADLRIRVGDTTAPFSIAGRARGFGLPNYRIREFALRVDRGGPTFLYQLLQSGLFTELETDLTLRLDPTRIRQLVVRLERGNIRVEPSPDIPLPALDLKTEFGRVSGIPQITADHADP